jgi:hypothetical protein
LMYTSIIGLKNKIKRRNVSGLYLFMKKTSILQCMAMS